MKLTSPAFVEGGQIPLKYSCEGSDTIPPLKIDGVPKEAKSLVLIMDDPDVPAFVRADQMFDHWVVFNITPTLQEVEEGKEPPGTLGVNTSGTLGYIGPCPPDREHRYFFKLFALDVLLDLPCGATKKAVEEAMIGHVIKNTELIGRYNKKLI